MVIFLVKGTGGVEGCEACIDSEAVLKSTPGIGRPPPTSFFLFGVEVDKLARLPSSEMSARGASPDGGLDGDSGDRTRFTELDRNPRRGNLKLFCAAADDDELCALLLLLLVAAFVGAAVCCILWPRLLAVFLFWFWI